MTAQSSLTILKPDLTKFASTQIYSRSEANIPNAREGKPTYADLLFHTSKTEDLMAYTGDYRQVYQSHTLITIDGNVVVSLMEPPVPMGDLDNVYKNKKDEVEIVSFYEYLNKGKTWSRTCTLQQKIVSIFDQFVEQEQKRSTCS